MTARTYRAKTVRRPAPRRTVGDGLAGRIDWDRLGRIVLVVVLFAVLASYVRPTIDFVGRWQESRRDRAELRGLQRENATLKRRTAELRRPDVLEREARKIGMVRAGERAYVLRGLDDRER